MQTTDDIIRTSQQQDHSKMPASSKQANLDPQKVISKGKLTPRLVAHEPYSFKNSKVHAVQLPNNQELQIQQLTQDSTARLCVVDKQGQQLPLPDGLIMIDSTGMKQPRFDKNYVISWNQQRYDVLFNGTLLLRMEQIRQHTIITPDNVKACVVQPQHPVQ